MSICFRCRMPSGTCVILLDAPWRAIGNTQLFMKCLWLLFNRGVCHMLPVPYLPACNLLPIYRTFSHTNHYGRKVWWPWRIVFSLSSFPFVSNNEVIPQHGGNQANINIVSPSQCTWLLKVHWENTSFAMHAQHTKRSILMLL